jgi:hypothetical protein
MTAALIPFAVMAALAVAAGEINGLPFRRRLADAARSRLPGASAQRVRLRR